MTTLVNRRPELDLIDYSPRYKEINQRSEDRVFDKTVPKLGVRELVVRSNPLIHTIHPLSGLEALLGLYSTREEMERSTMKQTITTKEARAFMEELRRELLRQKRTVGDPRAPMRARPGQEEAFEKVEANLARAELILKLLAMEALRTEKRKAVKAVDALLDGFIIFGLASAAMLGVAAAAVLLNAPSPVVQATAIIGVGVALARAVARK